jgi:hypothetical protein
MALEAQVRDLSRRPDFDHPNQVPMSSEALRASEAARRLQVSSKEVLRLSYDRKIRYVAVDGSAHVPQDAIDECQSRAAL